MERRQILPPDFAHGDVAVGSVYEVLGERWASRALFAVDDGSVVTAAYFDDYFLVIEQWDDQCEQSFQSWWSRRAEVRDRVITLRSSARGRSEVKATVNMNLNRRRLRQLERDSLGVVRESQCRGQGRSKRRRRGEVDVLSLVALTSLLCAGEARAAG